MGVATESPCIQPLREGTGAGAWSCMCHVGLSLEGQRVLSSIHLRALTKASIHGVTSSCLRAVG